jgi:hypothetical protein
MSEAKEKKKKWKGALERAKEVGITNHGHSSSKGKRVDRHFNGGWTCNFLTIAPKLRVCILSQFWRTFIPISMADEEWLSDDVEEELFLVKPLVHSQQGADFRPGSQIQVTGIDSATPLMQAGPRLFVGTHDETIGTMMLFSAEFPEGTQSAAQVAPESVIITHHGNTEKIVNFMQAVVMPEPKSVDKE